ncbi:MAG: hypothetical protein FWF82_06205 [Oscillospiraceae bacterium]|nr:hypothetical protein [Oscillospiraceae bacterium]
MSIGSRGFDKIGDNVYLDGNFPLDKAEVLTLIAESEARISDFFGEVRSYPTIIISDNKDKLAKMGLSTSPALTARLGAKSYVVISPDGMSVDVIAHELTHAELNLRLYKGKSPLTVLIPPWFDEGVALQNDYREKYNNEAWEEVTDNGENVAELSEMDTLQKFYSGSEEERRYRYIVSKHEVSRWLNEHGVQGLLDLLDAVSGGEDFNELYFSE